MLPFLTEETHHLQTLIKHYTVAKRPHTSPCTCTRTSTALLTSFISLLGTDLMIFPVKHKYFISVMYCLPTAHHHHLFTQTQGRDVQTSLLRTRHIPPAPDTIHHTDTLLLYPGSRQAASCPGTVTLCCWGTESLPATGCCSAPGAAEVSGEEMQVDVHQASPFSVLITKWIEFVFFVTL